MTENQINNQQNDPNHMIQRRNVIKMAAAGMPMVMTMRASASVQISQLQCDFQIPNDLVILVNEWGGVWINNLSWSSVPPLTQEVIDDLKNNAFFDATAHAPARFRPENTCDDTIDVSGDDDDDDECGGKKGKDDDDDDCEEEEPTYECQYNVFLVNSQTLSITDFVNSGGDGWDIGQGVQGLYVGIVRRQVLNGNTTGLAGISCVHSVVTYFDNL